jgi:putative redox protein
MDVMILAEEHIRLETTAPDAGLAIHGEPFGPLQMLATSLALCTASTIQSYADTAKLDVAGFSVEIRWQYADAPYRVGGYEMTLHLPDHLPVARQRAIARAADTCTVHQTLHHSTQVATTIQTFGDDPASHAQTHEEHHANEA